MVLTPLPTCFRALADGWAITIIAKPNARADAVLGLRADVQGRPCLHLAIKAPPVDGKANAAIIAFFARLWGLPKSSVVVERGDTSRIKRVQIKGDPAALGKVLAAWYITALSGEKNDRNNH